jgi:AcrR family transcriptional regulator
MQDVQRRSPPPDRMTAPAKGRPGRRPAAEREAVVSAARQRLVRGEPVEVSAIAAELGLGRATIHRWFGDRGGLLGEALWSLTETTFRRAAAAAHGHGAERIVDLVDRFTRATSSYEPLLALLRSDPAGTVGVILSPRSAIQARLADLLQTEIERERAAGAYAPALEPDEVAQLVVQVGMALNWSAALLDQPPDPDRTLGAIRTLLALERRPS